MSACPDGAQITSGTTKVRVSAVYGSPGSKYLAFYRVNVPWGTNSVTWNDIVPSGFDGASQSPAFQIPSNVAAGTVMTTDMSTIARQWYTRRAQDWKYDTGTLLRMCTTTTCSAEETSTIGELTLKKYNDSTTSYRPLLTLTYVIPALQVDLDPALGANYAPGSMTAGQDATLPVSIRNVTATFGAPVTAFTFDKCTSGSDTDCYQLGYRWFDGQGASVTCPSGTCTMDLAADVQSSGSSNPSALLGLVVRAPSAVGQYTLRLDLVHRLGGSTGTYVWSSDWASPSKYFSRDKRIAGFDSARWTGQSAIERTEFGIAVTAGGGTSVGTLQTIATGDGSTLGINLATKNLHYEGTTGLGFADLGTSLGLAYGYDRANLADCSGILKACGWFTNWDERIIPGAYDKTDLTYQGPSGNRYLGSVDGTGQIASAASAQLSRPRVTWFDENPLPAGATLPTIVSAASAGIPTYSGPNVVRTSSNTSTGMGQVPYVSLNQFPMVSFAARSTAASGTGVDFKIRNVTTGYDFWFVYELGTSFTTPFDHINLGGTLLNNWNAVVRRNLYNDVYTLHGSTTDEYQVIAIQTTTNGLGQGGYTYLDAVRFQGRDDTEVGSNPGYFKDAAPTWTSGTTTLNSSDKAVGTASLQVTSTALSSSPYCNSQGGATCWTSWNMTSWPFASWWWKKVGGSSIALQVEFQDVRTSAVKSLTYYAGALPSGVPTTCGPSGNQACAIQLDLQVPEGWTKITRNIRADVQQVLGFYLDNPAGSDPSDPPVLGPTPDRVRWLSARIAGIDGQYALFDNLTTTTAVDLDADDPAGSQYTSTAGEDYAARYADGTVHYFNAAGLLERIVDRDGNATTLDWTLDTTAAAGAGQAAYKLTTIHAPTDGTTNGYTYQREITVCKSGDAGCPTTSGFTQWTFTESLGSTGSGGSTPTGRTSWFLVATGTGTNPQYGSGDLVYVAPVRKTGTSCTGSRPTGCVEFDYTGTATHSLREVRDPRWDGTTGTSPNHFGFGVAYDTGSDPYALTDLRTGKSLLFVPSFNRSSGLYRVPIYQTASMRALFYATDVQLSPDGRVLTEYTAKLCVTQCTTSSTTWPAAAGTSDRRASYEFDGLAHVNQSTTYRTANANPIVTRQASRAGIRIDNVIDVLAGAETAWSQTADQHAAWVAASQPKQSDGVTPTAPYLTSYAYDAHHRVTHTLTPIANPQGTAPIADISTTYDDEGHPISTDDNTWVRNPGFEDGLTGGWSTYSGTAVLDTSTKHSGSQSVKLNHATAQTDHFQSIDLLPGQTFRLQGWAKAGSGTTARITVIYQRKSDLGYYTVGTLSTASTSWTQLAADLTIPTDGTGRIHVDLLAYANTTSWFDDISLFTTFRTATYATNGRLTDTFELDSASPTGLLQTKLSHVATNVHPAIYVTSSTANWVNGTPGPGTDEDVTSTADFDRWGRLVTTADPDGVSTDTTYAANQTDVASVTDGDSKTTTYAYDAVGNRLSTTTPLGAVTSVTYDLRNRPLVTTAPDGTKSANVYDDYGQRTSAIANYEDGTAANGDGTDDVITTFTYDPYGQIVSSVADLGGIAALTEATYDLAGNVVRSTTHTGDRVANGGFETSSTLATAWYNNAGYSLTTASKHAGAQALQMVVPNPLAASYAQTYRLSATAGNRYTVGAWIAGKAGNNATAGISLYARFFKADGTYSDTLVGSLTKGSTTSWSQISGTVTAPLNTVELFVFASLVQSAVGDVIYLDDVTADELRDTTTYFDAAGHAAAMQGPAEPGSSAPACPGASGEYCNAVSVFDINGRVTNQTDAYSKINRTLYDLAGRPVRSTQNYVDDVYSTGAPDTDIVAVTAYDLRGRVSSTTDVLDRVTTIAYDDLDRPILTTNDEGAFAKTLYTPAGRVDRTSALAASGTADSSLAWTKHVYDFQAYPGTGVGREVRSLDHYDIGNYTRTAMWAFEDLATTGWSTASSGYFTTTAAGAMSFDTDFYTVAPYTGRGRLKTTTHATNTNNGVWLDLSGKTFQAGRTYRLRADLIGSSVTTLTAWLGVDASGSNNHSESIATSVSWQPLLIEWTPTTTTSSNVHFALTKPSAGAISFYLDNVVIYDTLYPDYNIPSDTAYDADGRVVASVLPPGDPALDRPMVTLTTYDLAGRPAAVSVNAQTNYAHHVVNEARLTSLWPLDERTGTTAADKVGTSTGTYAGGLTRAVAGGVDDARTAVHFDGLSGRVTSAATIGTAAYSIEAWVKVDGPGNVNKGIAGRYASGSGALLYLQGSGAFGLVHNGTYLSSGVVPEPGRWYHVVATWTGATASMYVDGAFKTSTSISGATGTGSTSFEIGSYANGGASTFLAGSIDEVALYSSALPASGGPTTSPATTPPDANRPATIA